MDTPSADLPSPLIGRRGQAIWRSTKTYGHAEGLSCCFRQWRATHSHCRLLHGYALSFRLTFASEELDETNWCFDFGGLKPVKAWLHQMFDHTLLIARDDPEIAEFQRLADRGLVDLRVLPAVGCEATAIFTYNYVSRFVAEATGDRVWLDEVTVREHEGNSATYTPGRRTGVPHGV
ncbi:6-pyruvoyl trahydropterin synthase family protein [Muricoccus vinaceus]|uniref:6-carboxy-5,6,7,8-tetrahydropterin synthase n=1 Tax=Muricoccus vinaceus TaxID=424704 RepID=A0ABV6IQY2_9PROT